MTLGGVRYEVEDVVGRGAMGVVYRARQLGTGGRVVAYKRVAGADAELIARLRHEAEVLAGLDHPNIVRIFDVVDDGGGLAIVMQYAAGGTLAQVLAERGRVPPAVAVQILATVADALASAHRQGVLHRDVKPANILFTADGNPLLSDFGIARRVGSGPASDAGGVGAATSEYLDPAVAAGATFDERSDVYALGVVAYEALTGRRPFAGDTALAVLRAADEGRATPLRDLAPDVPEPLAQVVHRAVARDPRHRPAAAADLAGALRAALASPVAGGSLLGAFVPDAAQTHQATGAPAGGDAPRDDPPTRVFGPRPPLRPVHAEPPAPRWRRIAAVAAALLVLPPAIAVLTLRRPPPEPRATAAQPEAAAVAATTPPAPLCDDVPAPPRSEGVVTVDLDGRGCRSWVRYGDGVLEVARAAGRPEQFRLGAPGDQLVVGDWDCDGARTAALYRPATGEVFRFDRWPDADVAVTSGPSEQRGVRGGTAHVTSDGTCEDVAITPPGNTAA